MFSASLFGCSVIFFWPDTNTNLLRLLLFSDLFPSFFIVLTVDVGSTDHLL